MIRIRDCTVCAGLGIVGPTLSETCTAPGCVSGSVKEEVPDSPGRVPEPSLQRLSNTRIPFGKYEGDTLGEVADKDPLYLDWLTNKELYGKFRADFNEFMAHPNIVRVMSTAANK